MKDVLLAESDWAPYAVPVLLQRNVTLSGIYENPANWSVLDLGLLRGKVALGPGVSVNFTRVVLKGYRKMPIFQSPGFDLFYTAPEGGSPAQQAAAASTTPAPAPAPTPAPTLASADGATTAAGTATRSNLSAATTAYVVSAAAALVVTAAAPRVGWIDKAAMIHKVCIPPAETMTSISTAPRPAGDTGKQQTKPRVTQPSDYCVNDSSRWDLHRCWPAVGVYVDMASDGFDVNSYSQRTTMTGYVVRVTDTYFLCELVMTKECVDKYNIIGCYTAMLGADSRSTIPGRSGGGDDAGGERRSRLLAIVLPSVIVGALAGLLLVVAVSIRSVKARRGRHDSSCTATAAAGAATAVDGDGGGGDGPTAPARVAVPSSHKSPAGAGIGAPAAAMAAPKGNEDSTQPAATRAGAGAGDVDQPKHAAAARPPEWTPQPGGATAAQQPYQPLRCISDEVALVPLTPLTPVLSVVRLGVRVKGEEENYTEDGSGEQQQQQQQRRGSAATKSVARTGAGSSSTSGGSSSATEGEEVYLLPNQSLGAGAHGRVVVGVYGGNRVAVKLLNTGLLADRRAAAAAKGCVKDGGGEEQAAVAGDDDGQQQGGGGGGSGANNKACWPNSVPRDVLALAQEVEVLARCRHPNIVRLLAASLEPACVCLVMELMDSSLESLMYGENRRPMPLATVLHIGMQIARALSYLHPTILHRDLKPANVLISQAGSDTPVAKLADFGLSRLLNTVLITMNPEVGTAPYMAPETFDTLNTQITDRVDIYALGVILWELLAGARPWQGRSMFQIAYAITIERQRLPLDSMPLERCPPKLRSLIWTCWELDPARRPAAAEVVKALILVQEALV